MSNLVFTTDNEWRIALLAQIIKLQLSIYEMVCVLLGITIGAFITSRWWEYGPVTCAGLGLIYVVYAYRHELRDFKRLAIR